MKGVLWVKAVTNTRKLLEKNNVIKKFDVPVGGTTNDGKRLLHDSKTYYEQMKKDIMNQTDNGKELIEELEKLYLQMNKDANKISDK